MTDLVPPYVMSETLGWRERRKGTKYILKIKLVYFEKVGLAGKITLAFVV